jgi:hypothetical protein
MQAIHSGTTTERLVRAILLVIMLIGFAGWYLWDGYVGYPRANARALLGLLGRQDEPQPVINWEFTEEVADRIIADLGDQANPATIEARLGRPAVRHGDDTYYLGPGGHLRVSMSDDGITEAEWIQGRYGESEQKSQRWIGYVLGVLGLAGVGHFLGVLVTRVSLTEEGLKIGRRPLIPLEAISGLTIPARGRGNVVVVEYEIDGESGSVALDGYVVKKQPAIIAAIREQKGFPEQPGAADTSPEPTEGGDCS